MADIFMNIIKNLRVLWKAVPEKSSLPLYFSYGIGDCRFEIFTEAMLDFIMK